MIPARLNRLVFPFLMSSYMVFFMTFLITLLNTGFNDGFFGRWAHAGAFAWPIAFGLVLIGAPRLQRLAMALTTKKAG